MSKKKIGILLVVISITTLIATLMMFNKENKMSEEEHWDKVAEEIDKNYKSPFQKKYGSYADEYSKTNEVIYTFFDFINKKDYKTAYEMVDEDYKKDYDFTFEKFKALYATDEEKIFQTDDFIPRGNKFVLKGNILDAKAQLETSEKIQSLSKEFTVFEKGKLYRLADIGILEIKKLNIKENKRNIKIFIDKEIVQTDGVTYKIRIKNNTGNELKLLDNGYGIYAERSKQIYDHTLLTGSPYDYIIPSEYEKGYTVFFSNLTKAKIIGVEFDNGEEIKIQLKN